MEPWQYSSLQSQFSSLLQILSNTSSSKSLIQPSKQQEKVVDMGQVYNQSVRIGVKRKLNSVDKDAVLHKASCNGILTSDTSLNNQ